MQKVHQIKVAKKWQNCLSDYEKIGELIFTLIFLRAKCGNDRYQALASTTCNR